MMSVCEAELNVELAPRLREMTDSRLPLPSRGRAVPDLVVVTPGSRWLTAVSRPARRRTMVFASLWLFIGFVSAVDTYLTVKFQEHLQFVEENPVGLLLLNMANWDPSLLIGVKYMGSTMVLGFLTVLYLRNRRMGITVTAALAAFQFWLLCYLVIL